MTDVIALLATALILTVFIWGGFLLVSSKFLIGYFVSLRDIIDILKPDKGPKISQTTLSPMQNPQQSGAGETVVIAIAFTNPTSGAIALETTGANTAITFGGMS